MTNTPANCVFCNSVDRATLEIALIRRELFPETVASRLRCTTASVKDHMKHHLILGEVDRTELKEIVIDEINIVQTLISELRFRVEKALEMPVNPRSESAISSLSSSLERLVRLSAELNKLFPPDEATIELKTNQLLEDIVEIMADDYPELWKEIKLKLDDRMRSQS